MSQKKTLKAALVRIGPDKSEQHKFVFQYNPENLTRKLFTDDGVPNETISFSLILNVAEGIESQDPVIIEHGVYPQLAALELLFEKGNSNDGLRPGKFNHGSRQTVTLFKWSERIVPVRLLKLKIKEHLFDARLEPLHVKIKVKLEVLSESELSNDNEAQKILAAYRERMQQLAEKI